MPVSVTMYQIVLLCAVPLFLRGVRGQETRSPAPLNQTEVLQRVFQDFLHIKPHSTRKKISMSPSTYMVEVISQYVNERDFSDGRIVRGIHPMKGKIRGEEMFVFNMTGIERPEDIRKAQFHMYKKTSTFWKKYKDGTLRISLFYISLRNITSLTRIMASMFEPIGWQTYDITSAVRECRNSTDSNHLLGLKLEVYSKRKGYRPLPLKHFFRPESQPFVLVFSNDEPEIKTYDNAPEVVNNRDKRSIYDNRIHDVDLKDLSRMGMNNELSTASYYTPYYTPKTQTIDPRLIPYPTDLVPRKKIKKYKSPKKNKSKKRKNRKLPLSWNYSDKNPHSNYASKQNEYSLEEARQCRRRRLTVDFTEIGWGDWIIAPKAFEAHYCAGTCTAPLSKTLRPSNHATIQSLVHAFGFDPDVPAPCCVPDEMSSLTLIYFDEELNVVMKNYPNMSVKTCSCR